jgi:heptosyltransferase-2
MLRDRRIKALWKHYINMLRDLFYNYSPAILGKLYFRLGVNLVPEKDELIDLGGVKKICIFGTSGIGNLIMLTPMIRTLRAGIPDAYITVVVLPNGAKDVLEGGDLVDSVVVLDSKRKLKQIRDDWYDLAIAATHRGFMRAKRAFRTGTIYRLGFRYNHENKLNTGFLYTHSVPLDESKHEVEQGLDLIRPFGLKEVKKLYMRVTDEDREAGSGVLDEVNLGKDDLLMGFHIGPGPDDRLRGWRCWQFDRFAQLGDRLISQYGAKLVIVGGASEIPAAEQVAALMREKPIILAGKTTLRQTAALMERLRLFISNDSGPMHIAAAVGTRVIGIFGPTSSALHGPYGENGFVAESGLPCQPCHKPHEPAIECESKDCLKAISVDMVMEIASPILEDSK